MQEEKRLLQYRSYCMWILYFLTTAWSKEFKKKRKTKRSLTNTYHRSAIAAKLSLTGTPVPLATTMPTCIGGFDPPPPTLARMMLTALPTDVLAQLGNPNSRSSLASKFKAGETPDWFKSLNPAIRSYVASVQTRATTGCTPTPTPGSEGDGGANGVDASPSKALAARPTAGMVGTVSGVLGIFGLLFVL